MIAAAKLDQHHALCDRVTAFIRGDGSGGERALDRLALEVFAFQFETIAPYRRLCRGRGQTPDSVASWHDIPAVPAPAFKQYALFAGATDTIVRTFRSSGTTRPGQASSAHFSRAGLAVMDTAVAAGARARLFPDGRATRILVLAPPPERAPRMIMVHGMAHLIETFGLEGSRFVAGPGGVDFAALCAELDECQRAGVPVSLLGASFGFVHLFDWMEAAGRRVELPAGSRLMDAGGYKGRSREIERTAFVAWAARMCGIPARRVINLLGMTELASQVYDLVAPDGARIKRPPHWMRTQIVDPRSERTGRDREPADGAIGLLRHLDLANIERPIAIQSEDVGRFASLDLDGVRRCGFEIVGRARDAEPRGCSLSAENLAARSAS